MAMQRHLAHVPEWQLADDLVSTACALSVTGTLVCSLPAADAKERIHNTIQKKGFKRLLDASDAEHVLGQYCGKAV